ncbi:amino acid transporter LysE [Legionella norrlandica]|uniref:Amino acid transporter LysE n=1 Tax=Legionella norrlandica TaxID=1498499 RepID=A0A0A2SX76_9GAMM|nr:LysE/ArgO family amino acid transporter [Legionella norrlandica]KGP64034.1 amino acid transporter LysE [Legionella norrlandica]
MLIYFNGLLLGLSLIMALGPQNVFLLKQGARKNHAALSAAICFFCDVTLVCGSVAGLHHLLLAHPFLQTWMIWLGSIFLLYYAIKNLRSAFFKNKQGALETPQSHTRIQIIIFALGFSLLNPHAIIDTLVIVGSGSSQYPDHKLAFLTGVISASLLWFSSLTVTTRYFSDILTKAAVWRAIEFLSSILMAYIGIKLLTGNL